MVGLLHSVSGEMLASKGLIPLLTLEIVLGFTKTRGGGATEMVGKGVIH